ncbi:hypothetical protein ONE63_003453 [Megalurothrips usitatus]|uniref:Uncharacterized protein n=1 Tax=Megalurothrips usitatus TaxID=439358 RepID=A0AAV7X7B6_9NEOP|nr:hypothetical protein ONE63_003453 [Megalurothrips usitatus]
MVDCQIETFIAKLYQDPKLPRSSVQNIVSSLNDILCGTFMQHVKQRINSTLLDCGAGDKQMGVINSIFNTIQESLLAVSTEHRRFKRFLQSGFFIPPEPYELGEIDVPVQSVNGQLLGKKKVYGQSVPLSKLLPKLFDLPDTWSIVQSYLSSLNENPDLIQNYMQCSHWQMKTAKYKRDDFVLPIFPYYDDVQYNDALGPHADKFGGVYLLMPFLPEECRSKVENMLLALLFKTTDRACFGDRSVFRPLVQQLLSLEEEGICLNTPNGVKKVFFVTGLLLGDNLGLNSLLGFVECFTANFFCRFCKTERKVTHTQSTEDPSTLRDQAGYEEDIRVKNSSRTGIVTDCALSSVPSFHVTTNYCVDTFHDISEGIAHYVMINILKHCMPKYFTCDELNHRIVFFDYGPCGSNRIPLITYDLNSRSKLKMNGCETILFVKFFALLVGDRVLHDDPYWKLYLKLRELMDICFSKVVHEISCITLETVVDELNKMYVAVTKDNLKPKFHFLVHYPRIVKECGPLEGMSTKRLESNHRSLAIPAKATTSRTNPVKTMAIKNQLNLCYRFMCGESLLKAPVVGPGNFLDLTELDHFRTVKSGLPKCFFA